MLHNSQKVVEFSDITPYNAELNEEDIQEQMSIISAALVILENQTFDKVLIFQRKHTQKNAYEKLAALGQRYMALIDVVCKETSPEPDMFTSTFDNQVWIVPLDLCKEIRPND